MSSFHIGAKIIRVQIQLRFGNFTQIRHLLTNVARFHLKCECLLTSWRLPVVSHNWNSTRHCLFQFCHSLNLTMAVKLKLVEQCPMSWSNRHWAKFIRIQVGPSNILTSSQINFHSAPTIPWSGKGNGEGRQQDGGEDKNGDADRLDSLVDIFVHC